MVARNPKRYGRNIQSLDSRRSMEDIFSTAADAVNRFIWSQTEEGAAYWQEVYDRLHDMAVACRDETVSCRPIDDTDEKLFAEFIMEGYKSDSRSPASPESGSQSQVNERSSK